MANVFTPEDRESIRKAYAARDLLEKPQIDMLKIICTSIGYGRVQQLAGQLWDEMLKENHGMPPGRGAMGVTIKGEVQYTVDDFNIDWDNDDGSFVMMNKKTGMTTCRANYRQFTYLDGFVGCSKYWHPHLNIMSADKFLLHCAVI